MKKIKVGDHVTFEYNKDFLTGLVRQIILNEDDTESYEVIPSAIGFDHFLTIKSYKVKRANEEFK